MGADLPVLPGDKDKNVVVGRAPILERGLQSLYILNVETHVDRQAKQNRGWLDRREGPNVVIELPGVLFWMRRIGSVNGIWPAKGFGDDRRKC